MKSMQPGGVLAALGELSEARYEVNEITRIVPLSDTAFSVHQLVQLNGPHIAHCHFEWMESASGSRYLMHAKFPTLANKWAGQGSLPVECFLQVLGLYCPVSRIISMEVRGTKFIAVYSISPDGERRTDKYEFRKRRHKFRRPDHTAGDAWTLILHGGE